MKQAKMVQSEIDQVKTVGKLAEVFKGISSLHIARLKNQTLSSKQFFSDLWQIYVQLRKEHALEGLPPKLNRQMFIIITSEGGLSGDIDKKLVDWVLRTYDPKTTDITVLGHHGALQLAQRGIAVRRYYKVPDTLTNMVDTSPIIKDILPYESVKVFYQTYVTLNVQDIASLDLLTTIKEVDSAKQHNDSFITTHNYIFEPSVPAVLTYLESVMLEVALTQVILESKLAQSASRFNAMSASQEKANDMIGDLSRLYHRAKRNESDQQIRSVITGLGLSL